MIASRRYGILLLIALLFSVYTMTSAGKFHIVDEVSLFAVTESLVLRGAVDTNAIAWTQWVNSPGEVLGSFGPEGDVYSKKGPLPAFLAVPWYWLLHALTQLDMSLGLLQGALLWNGLVTAATAALLWLTANRLGYSNRTGGLLGLFFGLCTIAWPYANHFFGEPLSALSLLTCYYGLLTQRRTGQSRWMWLAGVGAAAAIATVTAHLLLVCVFALYWGVAQLLDWRNDRDEIVDVRSLLLAAAGFILPILFAGIFLLGYNAVRFGSPFDTGYHFDSGEGFTTPIWRGFWGLIASPYRGVFWHTPLFFVSLVAFVPFARRHRSEAALFAGLSALLVLIYSLWWMWWGGFAWGPRFLVPLTPFWVLPLAIYAQRLDGLSLTNRLDWRSLPARARTLGVGVWAMIGAALLSFGVQVLAVTLNYVNYEIRLRDLYPTDWEDPLKFGPPAQGLTDLLHSPVIGQLRLLRSGLAANSDLGWLWADGNVQWMVALIGFAVIATLVVLWIFWWLAARPGEEEEAVAGLPVRVLVPILPVLLLATWLGELIHNPHYGPPDQGYRAVIAEICRGDIESGAVITVAPFAYQIPMNWMPAQCDPAPAIYGYATSSMVNPEAQRVLARALDEHEQVWLVTAGLAANDPDNTVERWLVDAAYKAGDQWYDDYRLLHYATDAGLFDAPLVELNVPLQGEGVPTVHVASGREPAVVQPGQIMPIEIAYLLDAPSGADLHWFVQLLAPDGFPVALLDTGPNDGYASFSQLPAGEDLVEKTGLQLPPFLAPGVYQLIAGLYNPQAEGAPRLRTPDGSDFVELGKVEVVN